MRILTSPPPHDVTARIGIVGTGMIARSLMTLLTRHHPDLELSRVLTRRPVASVTGVPRPQALTSSVDDLIEHCDLIVECSGDAVHGTEIVEQALVAGRPVVTMNAELHVTTGSYLAGKGYLSEAEGDQPGSLAALHEEAVQMGFRPLVYGNMKGYLNLDPTPEDMNYWAQRQGLSVTQTTSFTDGTKVQIEQAFIANGTGSTILRNGLAGPRAENLTNAAFELAAEAEALGTPVADYVLASGWPANGVFVVGRHEEDLDGVLEYFKMGKGPYYMLTRPYHLCSLEVPKMIRRALAKQPPLLTNSLQPTIGVAAFAKRALGAGTAITTAIGGFQLRGEAVRMADVPKHVPIGLLQDAVLKRPLEPGQMITLDDVDLVDSRAVRIALQLVQDACTRAAAKPA